ncbi:MAG: Photosystem I assembly protein Ycf3 [Catillopecten margaritatus gill symbiont]|uniref:Photosystem I assembly protein Ycf3 n=1 Tax=Catillopecten margaritatus gill symbiont TaxID=3083288 RepID=A0AAU6PIH8_9GAMM
MINQTARGLFRSGITDPKLLKTSTVGRQDLLDDILGKLTSRKNKRSGINQLFIGPRGVGKTHFLSLIEQSIQENKALEKQYTVVRFPEESNRILSFADLLLEIINILKNIDNEMFQPLYERLETEPSDDIVIDEILHYLQQWHNKSKKNILLMIENLDVLLSEQVKAKIDIHKFRSFLMDNSHIIMIGTAPTYFSALNDVKHPVYDFFDIQLLRELNEDEIMSLIKTHLKWDKQDDLLKNFNSLKPKIQAMLSLTGGNPRLVMMFYGLISQDRLDNIKLELQKLLDKITPFYQDRLKDLAPQERALLETMALMRSEKRTPANISKQFRKSREITSVLLKRMVKSGYLSVNTNPDDKRSRIYRIKEQFFDIWLAMNESRGNRKYIPYVLDFFSMWYPTKKERDLKSKALLKELKQDRENFNKNNIQESLEYLSESSSDSNDRVMEKAGIAISATKIGEYDFAKKIINGLDTTNVGSKAIFTWMSKSGFENQSQNDNVGINSIDYFEKIVKYWKEQHSGQLERASIIFNELKEELQNVGLHDLHIALLKEKLSDSATNKEKGGLHNDIGTVEFRSAKYDNAKDSFIKSLEIRQEIGDKAGEGATLNNISQIYNARGDYETALKYLEQSLEIRQEIGDRAGEGTTLNNISQIYNARGDYETALKYLEQSLEIRQEIGDRAGEGATLNNISQIYNARGNYETALKYLEQSLEIMQEIGDRAGEGTTLNNISQIYNARGDYETALKYLEQSLEIRQEIGDKAGEGATLNNISTIYNARGDYETALKYLEQSLEIRQEIGDRAGEGTTLNNISQIYKARGNYETALKYLEQSLEIMQEIGDRAGEGATLNNISQIYKVRGNYEIALKYLEQSLEIRQEIGDRAGEGATLNNISQIYNARGDYETALKYLEQSLEITQEIGDKAGLCVTLFNIGHIHLQNNEQSKAMQKWAEVYLMAKEIDLAQALDALEKLAEQIGLENGLQDWEEMAQEFSDKGKNE